MSVLSQPKGGSTAIAENSEISLYWDAGSRVQEGILALALQIIHSLPSVRREKILEVRRLLLEDGYDLEERLDIALDRLLEDMVA
jgi:hypothetical protein